MTHPIFLVGGNSGIGLACARLLREQGRELVAAARSDDQLRELGIETRAFDARNPELGPEDLPEALSGLVYFPGTITLKPFHRLDARDFLDELQVNLIGAVAAIQAALPALKRDGHASIVLFSTVAVAQGMPFHSAVAAAKGAVEGLAHSLAAELAPRIRVNLVAPSLTDTPLASSLLGSDQKREAAAKRHPLERIGSPEEVARLVAFLLSDSSRSLSGQTLRPDNGLSTIRLIG